MAKKLEFWGALGTVIYLCVIALTVLFKFQDFQSLKLNELGDFLAGVFGPVAFLWLVLGFLQQGRELKLSTDALQLQAQELKNSVEQQSIMAQAAMQQIESQRLALRMQQEEVERSVSPFFRVQGGSRSGGGAGSEIKTSIQVFNDGPSVRDASISFIPPIGDVEQLSLGMLRIGSASGIVSFRFDCPSEDAQGVCLIEYLRADGKRIVEEFTYLIPSNNPFVIVEKRLPNDLDQAT